MNDHSPIRIATRRSALALAQARSVAAALGGRCELVPIVTRGDRHAGLLADAGGKGLFTAELETALLDGSIDLAVHSAKDLPTTMPDGLTLAAVPVREDPRDALISRDRVGLSDLPDGAVVGTSSLRRQAQLRIHRPDLRFTVLRGNVDTRIRKVLDDGQCDATVLAMAGLRRVGLTDHVAEVLGFDVVLPAAGQGALALQARADDDRVAALLAPIHHPPSHLALTCERQVVSALEGGCQAPLGVTAWIEAGRLLCRALVAGPHGHPQVRALADGPPTDPEAVAHQLVGHLRDAGADAILAACRRQQDP